MKKRSSNKQYMPKKQRFTSNSIAPFINKWLFVFLIVSLLLICFVFSILPFFKIIKSYYWIKTPCKIVHSEVKSSEHPIKPSYVISIHFEYIFGNKKYIGRNYDFDDQTSRLHERKHEIISKYPVGFDTICFVDPIEPSNAVLYRGVFTNIWFGFLPISIFLLLLFLNKYLKKNKNELY